MEELRNCAFQYAYKRWNIEMVCDKTNLTFEEAKDLFLEYKQDIINKLQDDDYSQIEACIWINMPDEYTFGDYYLYITDEYKTDGKRIWTEEKQYINL